jgi:hypothetical protein
MRQPNANSDAAMSRNRSKKNVGRFAGIPIWILESVVYASLSPLSKALLYELTGQYNGHNNGYLSLTRSDLKRRGFPTNVSNQKAIESLMAVGLITRTRVGGICRGKHVCHLYSVNWQSADELRDRPFDMRPMTWLENKKLIDESGREPMIKR